MRILLPGTVFVGWLLIGPATGWAQSSDWRDDWALAGGLTMEIDSEGYHLPTSIAVVPEPGPGPEDPLYFVTELEGVVKVVTRDGRVRTFAEGFFERDRPAELPEMEAESGLGGICLAADQGYVFVTYAYSDSLGLLRNGIRRFETEPGRFSVRPTADTLIAGFLARDVTSVSHQIGTCQVREGLLYFGVGDGQRASMAQSLSSSLGKIHRVTLDGRAPTDNPFRQAGDPSATASYVWAYGFRNPYALAFAGPQLFVAGNGISTDRFVVIDRGRNYLWDGTDQSIGSAAQVSFYPAISPVQMLYYAGGGALPEDFDRHFLMTTSGGPGQLASDSPRLAKALVGLPWDASENRLTRPPRLLVRYVGDRIQAPTGLGVGPAGVYLAPIFPIAGDRSVVFRISRDSTDSWPTVIGPGVPPESPRMLMLRHGCDGCHGFGAQDTTLLAPTLHAESLAARIRERLASEAYRAGLIALDASEAPLARALEPARRRLLEAPPDSAVWTYVYLQLMDPRFDNLTSGMPVMTLTERDAETLADYLVGSVKETPSEGPEETPAGPIDRAYDALRVMGLVPDPLRYRHIAVAFVLGALLVLGFVGVGTGLRRRAARRDRP